MKRDKSGILSPAENAKAKEPETGPGSATCYCRRMDRREKALESHLALRARQGGQNVALEMPKFHDMDIIDLGDLASFYVAVKSTLKSGRKYRLRLAVVA
jgi:hypothetical protein